MPVAIVPDPTTPTWRTARVAACAAPATGVSASATTFGESGAS